MSNSQDDVERPWSKPMFFADEGRMFDESQDASEAEPPWLQPLLIRDDGSYVDESDSDYEYWRLEELEYDFLSEVFEADKELISLLKLHKWEEVYLRDLESRAIDEQQLVSQRLHPAEARRLLSPLTEHEKEFLKKYHGLDIGRPRTVHETAEFFSLTPEIVERIEKDALDKLKYATGLPLPTTEAQQLPRVDTTSPNVSQVIGLLERLSILLSDGHITREEFETFKAKVMHEYK
jgi:hypothetical protein